MRNWGSFWRGVLAMPHWTGIFCRWGVRRFIYPQLVEAHWWLHYWLPAWHKRRGPYVSIGLGFFAIYRGY